MKIKVFNKFTIELKPGRWSHDSIKTLNIGIDTQSTKWVDNKFYVKNIDKDNNGV